MVVPGTTCHAVTVVENLESCLYYAETSGTRKKARLLSVRMNRAQILFLRGHPTPAWITTVGAKYTVDPEILPLLSITPYLPQLHQSTATNHTPCKSRIHPSINLHLYWEVGIFLRGGVRSKSSILSPRYISVTLLSWKASL